MEIKKIKKEDIKIVHDFLLVSWLNTYVGIQEGINESGIREIFNKPNKFTPAHFKEYGAFMDDKLVAYICYIPHENEIVLKALYVDKKYQHKGIGSVLMKKILDYKLPVELSVASFNLNARRFYEKFGFKYQENKAVSHFVINGIELEEVVYRLF